MASGRDILDNGGGSWWRAEGPERTSGQGVPAPRGPVAPRDARSAAGWRARLPSRRLLGPLLVAALVGGLLGAYVDRRLREAGADAAASAAFDLRLDDETLLGVTADPRNPSYAYQLQVRNAGPRPVVLVDVALLGDPLSSDPLRGPVTLSPEERVPVDVTGNLDCGAVADGGVPPVTLSLTARTADGHRHVSTLGAVDSEGRRSLIHSCGGRSAVQVRQSVPPDIVGRQVVAQLDLSTSTDGVRVVGLHIEPAGPFYVEVHGLPLRLSQSVPGQVLVTAGVASCTSALTLDPAQATIVLGVVGAPHGQTSVPLPEDLAVALVRLSERVCPD